VVWEDGGGNAPSYPIINESSRAITKKGQAHGGPGPETGTCSFALFVSVTHMQDVLATHSLLRYLFSNESPSSNHAEQTSPVSPQGILTKELRPLRTVTSVLLVPQYRATRMPICIVGLKVLEIHPRLRELRAVMQSRHGVFCNSKDVQVHPRG